jgi:glycerate 2-kinase
MNSKPRSCFQNRELVTNHGSSRLRQLALDILEHGLLAADPGIQVRASVSVSSSILKIFDKKFDLREFERIFIFGAGKATLPIAQVLEELLEDRISNGVIILKKGSQSTLKRCKVFYGAHPIPDEEGNRGAKEMFEMAGTLTKKDLVLTAFTGGSSALLPLPADGISLDDKKKVNKILLNSGADITQINSVRKHLSRIKGGFLARRILPATIINLTVSDVIGDMLDYITDPTVADTSTFDDARKVIGDFDLWDKLPVSVKDYLKRGGPEQETPKDFGNSPLYSFIVLNSAVACMGAAAYAKKMGLNTMVLTTMLQGEARDAGVFLSSIAKEVVQYGRPLQKPCAIIMGGENTVTINGSYGSGGPNQELALSASLAIAGIDNIVIASIDTDGTDGPTDICGGIVDGSTFSLANKLGLDIRNALRQHDVSPILQQLGDAVITGQSGTNVNDLKLILVG